MPVLPSLVCFLTFLIIASLYDDRLYRVLGLLALAGHIIVAVVVLPLIPFRWDIGHFHTAATELLSGEADVGSTTVTTFATFQSIIYAIFGADPTTISIINGLLAVLIPLPAAYLAHKLYGDGLYSVDGVVATILFLPLPFLFLTIPMRDALSTFLAFVTLALVIHTLTERDPALGLVIIPMLAVLYPLRPELSLVLLLGTVAGLATIAIRSAGVTMSLPTASGLLAIIGAIGFVLFAEVMVSLERINESVAHRASGGASYLDGFQYTSWLDLVITAPGRAIFFQFAPFPLHVETGFQALALFSAGFALVFAVAAFRSLTTCDTDEVVLVTLVVVYLAGITGYGLINSNFGTNVRHRIPFVFLLVVFAAPVIQRWELWLREWLGIWPDEDHQHHGENQETGELDRDVQV